MTTQEDKLRGPTGQDGATYPTSQQLAWLYAERGKEMLRAVEEKITMEMFMNDAVNYFLERRHLIPFHTDKIPFSRITERLKEMREEGKMNETDEIALSKLIKRCEGMCWEYKYV